MPLDGILWLGSMCFLLSYYSIICSSLKLQNFVVVVAKSNLVVKYFNNAILDNSFMFIIVTLPRPAKN